MNYKNQLLDNLPAGPVKSKAIKLFGKGNLHQIIRKEILFGLVPKTLSGMRLNLTWVYSKKKIIKSFSESTDQMHAIGNLTDLLYHGGFLPKSNGLNSLPTFRTFSRILQKPNGFQFTVSEMSITSFIQHSTQRK